MIVWNSTCISGGVRPCSAAFWYAIDLRYAARRHPFAGDLTTMVRASAP